MEDWPNILASDYCYNVTDGTHDSPKPVADGRYLITSKHIKNNEIDFASAYKISENDYQKIISRSRVNQWDIIISMIGAYCGFCYIESSNKTDYAIKNVGLFKVGDEIKCKWLYYYLTSPQGRQQLSMLRSGSTQPYIALNSLRNLSIPVPNLDVMESIVSIMDSIDAKIKVNRKINDNLEQQAQALYKSWFVDFEPFKDCEFVDSELGLIPEGWQVGTYEQIIQTTISGDWGKDIITGNYTHKVACVRGCDFQDMSIGVRGKTPERYILEKNYQAKRLIDNDVIVEISGGTSTISTGRVCLINNDLLSKYNNDIVCTNFCKVVRPIQSYGAYLYYSWKYKYDCRVMFGYENGTSGIKNFQISDFLSKEPVIIPSESSIKEFQMIIDTLQNNIQTNGSEIMKLESLRDSLLPKLMSGELEINKIDC